VRVSASEASVAAAEATAAQYATALAGARHALDDSRAETAMLRGKLQALSSASTDAETLAAKQAVIDALTAQATSLRGARATAVADARRWREVAERRGAELTRLHAMVVSVLTMNDGGDGASPRSVLQLTGPESPASTRVQAVACAGGEGGDETSVASPTSRVQQLRDVMSSSPVSPAVAVRDVRYNDSLTHRWLVLTTVWPRVCVAACVCVHRPTPSCAL